MIIRSLKQKQEASVSSPQVHRMANQMRRYFAPRSMLPPPGSVRGATGNRNVSLTAANSANAAPSDSAIVKLQAGSSVASALWAFTTKFNNAPIITAIALTTNPNGPQELTIQSTLNKGGPGVIIQSTDPADTRLVHVTATGNPN